MSAIVRIFDIRQVGTCPTCMRISFLVMVFSWVNTAGVWLLSLNAASLVGAISILFTLLWMAHIVRRAVWSTRSYRPQDQSRRLAIRFALALAGSAAISVALPRSARADSGCGGWGGNSGCPPCSDYGRGECMRQNSGCGCYYCHSCGADCPQDNTC